MQTVLIGPELPSYLLAGGAYAALGLYLLRGGYLSGAARMAGPPFAFALAAVASAAWALLAAAGGSLGSLPALAASASTDALRYGAWFWFLLMLLPSRLRARSRPRLDVLALGLAAAGTALPWVMLLDVMPAVLPQRLVFALVLLLPMLGLVLVEQLLRNLSDDSRWTGKPLCIGLALLFAFDFYALSQALMFGRLDAATAAVRGAVHALAVPFLVIAARRRSRQSPWIDRLNLSRTAAFRSLALLLAGGYLLFASAIGYYLRLSGGSWGEGLQLGLLVAALAGLAILTASGTVRSRLRVLVGKHFFRYRYDYRVEWLRFTRVLAGASSPQEMGVCVIHGLADLVESPGGALWTLNLGGNAYAQSARWNTSANDVREPSDGALAKFLAERGWIVRADEYREHPQRYGGLELPAWAVGERAPWLIVPLTAGEDLIGFVTLEPPRTPVDVNWEVTDLLKTASRQAAAYLAQMQATEALLEARKFDAFNRMSAFVVHDLKNIVTQLSLMLRNAERLQDNAEFRQDMLLTVESSLDKMRQMILQLREGAAPPGHAAGVALQPIAERVRDAARRRGRSLELRIETPVVTRGHDERIERVIGHMVHNALDATPENGSVWLKLSRDSGLARVEIGDTGIGMSPEFVRDRLFKPFQSSKAHGMGIGAYESFQYVQELGGRMLVDSQVGRGTVITLLLPLLESRTTSDLHTAAVPA